MNLPLHFGVKSAETWVYSSKWKPSKSTKYANISWRGFVLQILGYAKYFFIDYLEKGKTIHSDNYIVLLVSLKDEITKRRPQMLKKKCSFTKTMHRVTSRSQRWENYINCTSNCFWTHPFSRDLSPSNNWLFAEIKKMFQGKILGSNVEVISETDAYFEVKDKSFNKNGTELLEKRSNQYITLEGDYFDE